MRLLGWMHRKFKHNSNESLKDLAIGQPSSEAQQYYRRSNYGTKTVGKAERDNILRRSFAGLEAARVEDEDFEEESVSALFHGFLTIGTLGSDTAIADPSTPTFAISVDNITERETEVTANELKLINDELEKVLEAEAKEDSPIESSRRNSYVGTGRVSHSSTITLSGKPITDTELNGNGTIICPLRGYLFGSAVELPETTTAAKKEHRLSLGELFQRTKIEDFSGAKCDRWDKRTEKETDKSAVHVMKKMLKRRMLHGSSRSSNVSTRGNVDSASTERKPHKILHMFHRKVHPENSTSMQKCDNPHKDETKNRFSYEREYNNGDKIHPDEDIIIVPQKAFPKKGIRRLKSQSNPPQVTFSNCDSNENREHWIKTDADLDHKI